jgi:hypothetical protein
MQLTIINVFLNFIINEMCVREESLKIARGPPGFYGTQFQHQWFKGRINSNQVLDFVVARNTATSLLATRGKVISWG